MREALSKNERWTKEYVPVVQPMLQRQDIRFLNPVVDLQPPAPGGVYELRIYRMHPGKAGQWAQVFKAVMPVRQKYSKYVGIWTGEAPQPNEVLHMWNYPDLNRAPRRVPSSSAIRSGRHSLRRTRRSCSRCNRCS